MTSRNTVWIRMLTWHLVSTLALLVLPTLLLSTAAWRLPDPQGRAFGLLVLGFLLSGLLPVVGARRGRTPGVGLVVLMTTAVFGVVFLALLLLGWAVSRTLLAGVFVTALLVIPLLAARPRSFYPLLALAGLMLGAAALGLRRRPAAEPAPVTLIQTSLYSLDLDFRSGVIPPPRVRGGGIARLGNRYLLLTGDGLFYLLEWRPDDDSLLVRPLPYRVPANLEEFMAAAVPASGAPQQAPHWFRGALGLQTSVSEDSVRLYASYLFWRAEQQCYVVRVAGLHAPLAAFLAGSSAPAWRIVYEASPCLALSKNRFADIPMMGHETGGRLIMVGRDSLLLSVGYAGFDGVTLPGKPLSRDRSASYGKTILIHLDRRPAEVFSMGHRNPQGLYRASDGSIWLTEHGARGGDELNLIVAGGDYGWPSVTYGTDYGSMQWLSNPRQGSHEGFAAPVHAWVPSVAVSDLLEVTGPLLPAWRGDLLVGTLTDRSLYRIRFEGRRVAYTERLAMNRRIRSLVEGEDGRIVLWTDENAIGSLRPNRGTTGASLFALRCGGCHNAADGTQHLIGPDLGGILGRQVGSIAGASAALRALGGKWTAQRLEAFITSPNTLAPGTRMTFPGVADPAERKLLIEFLRIRR